MQNHSRKVETRQAMSNRQIIAVYVTGVVLLLVAFAAGLSVIKKGEQGDPLPPKGTAAESSDHAELQFEVFVAAFGTLTKAKAMEEELKDRRYLAAHIKAPSGGDALYRVYIGPYTRSDAEKVAAEISSQGVRGVMVEQIEQD
jgi:cell division septation protein DedD